jgi:hypothetical protein
MYPIGARVICSTGNTSINSYCREPSPICSPYCVTRYGSFNGPCSQRSWNIFFDQARVRGQIEYRLSDCDCVARLNRDGFIFDAFAHAQPLEYQIEFGGQGFLRFQAALPP